MNYFIGRLKIIMNASNTFKYYKLAQFIPHNVVFTPRKRRSSKKKNEHMENSTHPKLQSKSKTPRALKIQLDTH